MKRGAVLAAVALAATMTACSSGSSTSGSGPPTQQDPSYSHLVAVAHLAACPPSNGSGGDLPDVTLKCLGQGPAVRMSGLTGQPTVVNVWAQWCVPCQKEATYLASAYDADKRAVRFLGVDTEDTASAALDFVAHVSPQARYPSVVDPSKTVLLSAAKQPGPPATLFVDAAGDVVHIFHGQYTSTTQLQHDIAAYLHVRT